MQTGQWVDQFTRRKKCECPCRRQQRCGQSVRELRSSSFECHEKKNVKKNQPESLDFIGRRGGEVVFGRDGADLTDVRIPQECTRDRFITFFSFPYVWLLVWPSPRLLSRLTLGNEPLRDRGRFFFCYRSLPLERSWLFWYTLERHANWVCSQSACVRQEKWFSSRLGNWKTKRREM